MQFVIKISKLCDPDRPMLQTDMPSQDRALHYSASCSKNLI